MDIKTAETIKPVEKLIIKPDNVLVALTDGETLSFEDYIWRLVKECINDVTTVPIVEVSKGAHER